MSSANSDTNDISYTYNFDGIRTSKTINGVTTTYIVDDNYNIVEQTDGTNTIKFVYDSSNAPVYMVYNGVTYYYERNLQGDIVGLLDEQGNSVVQYTYDIWGVVTSITGTMADTLGADNPLRYRGYYDTETSLYYLQSRYYSPELMRFISQDSPYHSNAQGQPLGSNLYAYCMNNPVMNSDKFGTISIPVVVAGLAAVLVVSTIRLSMAMYLYGISGSHFVSKRDFSTKKSNGSKWFYFAEKGGNVAILIYQCR